MSPGDTFFYKPQKSPKEHLYVVISDSAAQSVVIVNFTTFKGGSYFHDDGCVVNKHEHPFIDHKSWVNYAEAEIVSGPGLAKAIQAGLLRTHSPVSPQLLSRIRDGAIVSEHTPRKCRQMLLDQGLASEAD